MGRTVRIGIGGPIGCGKTELIEKIVPEFVKQGYKVGIISNDIYSKEDAKRLVYRIGEKYIDPSLIVGIETGMCPHSAVRDDPSMNLDAVESMEKQNPDLDLILIESGGDNITLTFSSSLADYFIYMIDVASGDKTVRKGGLGIRNSDLLIINKIDLAPYVESTIIDSPMATANVSLMKSDADKLRGNKPTILASLKMNKGIDEIVKTIKREALFVE